RVDHPNEPWETGTTQEGGGSVWSFVCVCVCVWRWGWLWVCVCVCVCVYVVGWGQGAVLLKQLLPLFKQNRFLCAGHGWYMREGALLQSPRDQHTHTPNTTT